MTKRRWLALLFVWAVCAASALPAFAHAALLASTPAANATLDRAPAQVELLFTEPLEPSFSTITVLNTDGTQVDGGDVRVDPAEPTRMTVSLRSLVDGVYTVSWKSLSTADGHVTTGSFPFVVGEVEAGALPTPEQVSRSVRVSLVEIVAKWLSYLSLAALTGGSLFILLVWSPVVALQNEPNWLRLAALALIGLALAMILAALTQAGQASGVELVPPWSPVVGTVLSNTRYGALWLARLCSML
ncbi:MAG: copper resistance CopC family protein, partial [Anaerolineales bacterium]